ncbi:MAG: bifunctional 5,10-methylenetetrahydrofolate dehydrogenase/5,10-methenyltetrahydrofolate cyclohydrolase [Deltaproteobacteria bacterium]|nr:bifunctional 5,10-methylenetetrahydrofolate dehydrogenase/5,10-methenyltetrahydrofolate cyclohydrolase [Deltaproteobacteria bacterium]
MTGILDGKKTARDIRAQLRERVHRCLGAGKRSPFLAVILVGNDPASRLYVGHKEKACREVGIASETYEFPEKTDEEQILKLVRKLNQDDTVDGILVQLPLPAHICRTRVISAIEACKDVDGLTPVNQGMLAMGLPSLRPCTPVGILELLRKYSIRLDGQLAAVIGRSHLVGSPLCRLLSLHNATVINIHRRSPSPESLCRQADIVIAAAGQRHLVTESWVREGAVVVDVGIHRTSDGHLTGDVDFSLVSKKTAWITPVPGGVGPMTIASLLSNCLMAFGERAEKDETQSPLK